jgi:hypothetical protein
MTRLLDQALAAARNLPPAAQPADRDRNGVELEAARNLPPAAQDAIARVVLRLAGNDDEEPSIALSPEEQAAVAASKAAAARGEFATDEQVRSAWAKQGL